MTYIEMPPGVSVQPRVSEYGWPTRKRKRRHARHRRRVLARRAALFAATNKEGPR